MSNANPSAAKIPIAISACLLGESVRFNGGHKESRLCTRQLSEYFDYLPICPEVGIGLSIPREPIRLTGDPAAPQARGVVHPEQDFTQALAHYAQTMAKQLKGVSGYILMQKSPSCGMERVKVYQDNGYTAPQGASGIYTQAIMAAHPALPMEEDGRLNDPVLRENFLTRVFAHARWQQLCQQGLNRHHILAYHADYKFQLLASDPQGYRELGQLLGNIGHYPVEEIADRYFIRLMQGLKRLATRGTHANVLQHLAGYLKHELDSNDRREIGDLIDHYREGLIPLVVPLTLLKHHLRHHPDPYLSRQAYLQPHPEALCLRNAI